MENINISLKKRVYFFSCNYDYKKKKMDKEYLFIYPVYNVFITFSAV